MRVSRRARVLFAGAALTAVLTAAGLSSGIGAEHSPTVNVHASPGGGLVP